MVTIENTMLLLCFVLASLAVLTININNINKRIDEILAEEERQNKRIDSMEKLEQIHQSKERHDKAYAEAKDFFSKW